MDGIRLFSLTLHVIGFTFWVGGLFAVALTLNAARGEEPPARARIGAVARRVARIADGGAAAAIAGGLGILQGAPALYLVQPWFHMKLTFVVGMLAVHGIVRVRAKRLANGGEAPGPGAALAIAALAVAIIFVVIFKPMAK